MRGFIVAAVACAFLVLAPVASADHLSMTRAKGAESKDMRSLCDKDHHCSRYGIVKCKRRSARRVNCLGFNEGKDKFGKYTCTIGTSWTAKDGQLWPSAWKPAKCVGGWRY